MDRRKWTDKELIEAVKNSFTISDTLRKLNLGVTPGNFKTINKYINLLNIDIKHFTGKAHGTTKAIKYSIEQILIENSNYVNNKYLIKRCLELELISNICYICKSEPTWQNKKLVLQLDHINGVNTDNRLENLRLLCPNCHSQTDTFCRKSVVK